MRVSRTRFSKRRSKRKTEFPIVAVVQKKRKVESIKSQSSSMLNNEASSSPSQTSFRASKAQNSTQFLVNQNEDSSSPASSNFVFGDTKSKTRQNRESFKPHKKSRATIDYKNIILLRNLITAEGKILPRRINKLTAKQQRSVQKAIKSARIMGLIPFINKSRPFS